jgi:hypothetical protein
MAEKSIHPYRQMHDEAAAKLRHERDLKRLKLAPRRGGVITKRK